MFSLIKINYNLLVISGNSAFIASLFNLVPMTSFDPFSIGTVPVDKVLANLILNHFLLVLWLANLASSICDSHLKFLKMQKNDTSALYICILKKKGN